MEKNTVLLQDTEAFMHGELDNVTVQQNCIVLDLVQGGYVPYGCYTSAPIPMPLFDALRVSWNAASPEDTAVEAQARVMVDGVSCPLLGRVTMDQIMVDVSRAPHAEPGMTAEIMGPHIPVTELAEKAGTISWEIFTGIGPRVPRHYTH